jgi:hypothetical protein
VRNQHYGPSVTSSPNAQSLSLAFQHRRGVGQRGGRSQQEYRSVQVIEVVSNRKKRNSCSNLRRKPATYKAALTWWVVTEIQPPAITIPWPREPLFTIDLTRRLTWHIRHASTIIHPRANMRITTLRVSLFQGTDVDHVVCTLMKDRKRPASECHISRLTLILCNSLKRRSLPVEEITGITTSHTLNWLPESVRPPAGRRDLI